MRAIRIGGLVILVTLLMGVLASAQDGIERPRQVIGSGVSVASGAGQLHLAATVGQPLVGPVSGSGDVDLGQGFWYAGAVGQRVYLPLLLRE